MITFFFFFFLFSLSLIAGTATAMSTIEPCSSMGSCPALLGYTLYADLKFSEVAALFQVDPVSLLAANAIHFSLCDVENRILPSGLFLRRSLSSIAASVYAGLTSLDQIQEANSIQNPSAIDVGRTLVAPLPCTCMAASYYR